MKKFGMLIAGLFIGAVIGFFIAALCAAARKNVDRELYGPEWDGWYPISDPPDPREFTSVLVYSKTGGVAEAYRNAVGEWMQYRGNARIHPTHWRPKPVRPQEILREEHRDGQE